MTRSRAFPIVVVIRRHHPQNMATDTFLVGMIDGKLYWDDRVQTALRFSSAAAASQVCARVEGAKIRVAFA